MKKMRKMMVLLILVTWGIGSVEARAPIAPNGLSVTVTVTPSTINLGDTVHISGTVTNTGNRDLVLYHTQLYTYRNVAGCGSLSELQSAVPIASGETLTFEMDFVPLCAGEWDAAQAVQPKKLVSGQQYLIAERPYLVQ